MPLDIAFNKSDRALPCCGNLIQGMDFNLDFHQPIFRFLFNIIRQMGSIVVFSAAIKLRNNHREHVGTIRESHLKGFHVLQTQLTDRRRK